MVYHNTTAAAAATQGDEGNEVTTAETSATSNGQEEEEEEEEEEETNNKDDDDDKNKNKNKKKNTMSSSSSSPRHMWLQLITWKDPYLSSCALVGGCLFLLLVKFGKYTLLSLGCYLLLLQLLLNVFYKIGIKYTQKLIIVAVDTDGDEGLDALIPREHIEFIVTLTYDVLNWGTRQFVHALRFRDMLLVARTIVGLIVLSILGRFLDGVTLVGVVYVILFASPWYASSAAFQRVLRRILKKHKQQ